MLARLSGGPGAFVLDKRFFWRRLISSHHRVLAVWVLRRAWRRFSFYFYSNLHRFYSYFLSIQPKCQLLAALAAAPV